MRVPLLAALLLSGCAGIGSPAGHACEAGTLHAEWDEPGLHARLAGARAEGVAVESRLPSGPRVRDATLNAKWGDLALVEAIHSPGSESGVTYAQISRDPWPEGDLQIAVSVERGQDIDDAVAMARVLMARIGVAPDRQDAHEAALRAAWHEAPSGVANSVAAAPFTDALDWDRLPRMLFPDAAPQESATGTLRTLRLGEWRLTLATGTTHVEASPDGLRMVLDVAADDHVRAFVDLGPGETPPAGMARVNATLAKLGLPDATFAGYQGAVAVC